MFRSSLVSRLQSPRNEHIRDDLEKASLAARKSLAAARGRGKVSPPQAERGSTWSAPGSFYQGSTNGQSASSSSPAGAEAASPVASGRRSSRGSSSHLQVPEDGFRSSPSNVRSSRQPLSYEESLQMRLTERQDRLQQRLTNARQQSLASMNRGNNLEDEAEAVTGEEELPWAAFVDGEAFRGFIAAVLLLNMWALAVESDVPEWPWWDAVNGLLLLVYIAEFGLHVLHRGPTQLLWLGQKRRWMAYDLFVVGIGLLDVAYCALHDPIGVQKSSLAGVASELGGQVLTDGRAPVAPPTTGQFSFGRFLMLSRLLRIVRVLRLINPLYDCVILLTDMMSTFIYILTMIFLLCFVLAIILTRLLGHGLVVKTEDEDLKGKVRDLFADIPTSIFTLFQLTTAEDWTKIAGPVVETGRLWRAFFVAFITVMSWTMLSLLTAVASETMISFSSSKKEEEKIYQEIQRHNFVTFLCGEFLRADRDGNRSLNREEFTALMARPSMVEEMKSHGIQLADQDLIRVWDTFDIREQGEIGIDELVTGFAYLQENLTMKHVANLGSALKKFKVRMDTDLAEVQAEIKRRLTEEHQLLERTMQRSARVQEFWEQFLGADAVQLRAGDPHPNPPQQSYSAWSTGLTRPKLNWSRSLSRSSTALGS